MVTASSRLCHDGAFLSDVAVGALPDMVTLTTPDGTRVLTTLRSPEPSTPTGTWGACVGNPTIGYGHLVRDLEQDRYQQGITEQEAEDLLRRDVQGAERAVLRLIDVPLTDGQYDALVSFTFNLGAGALQRSTLRRKVNREAHAEVPAQLMRWVWAGGKRLRGLELRRRTESLHYLSS